MSFMQMASNTSSPALQAAAAPAPAAAAMGSSCGAVGGYATDPDALRNLIVNYLPPLMNEAQVYELFGQFGKIESVKIIYDKITGESRGYGFVKYQFFFSATYAVSCLNRFEIGGKKLKVAYANAQAAKEAYEMVRLSTMALSLQQQQAMQSMYFNQMMLSREEGANTAQLNGADGGDFFWNGMGGGYAASQRSGASSSMGGGGAAAAYHTPSVPGAARSSMAPITPIGL
ncbi:putative mitochondrial RNA-binding protein [Leptomonas pyrrhocoris]|uniref:Putative mitochondrial RNA-binding protein n=1 Tax=Leptomonas pyrrhocoris TaxID=157538 RepID=A0A0M9G056_LEPPY|nr:putative mitochondrial RNA-binding protein [Leptomonas pyrrhocoris]KPA79456.1 putative mitochondrial RNA-binding protein [Leptomonas pyrrhocoris]|eukprot:XP_015657895.1 putative mitochondrial RNA-binding protein [Leptomonas pyrrhocoris]